MARTQASAALSAVTLMASIALMSAALGAAIFTVASVLHPGGDAPYAFNSVERDSDPPPPPRPTAPCICGNTRRVCLSACLNATKAPPAINLCKQMGPFTKEACVCLPFPPNSTAESFSVNTDENIFTFPSDEGGPESVLPQAWSRTDAEYLSLEGPDCDLIDPVTGAITIIGDPSRSSSVFAMWAATTLSELPLMVCVALNIALLMSVGFLTGVAVRKCCIRCASADVEDGADSSEGLAFIAIDPAAEKIANEAL